MNSNTRRCTLLILLFIANLTHAATDERGVMEADARFWRAYNECDMKQVGELLSKDAEFYHDMTGLTVTRAGIVESLRVGPCADRALRLRRELVSGSQMFHPLAGGYAILSGEHRFYVTQAGQPERLDGQAEFTTVWKLDAGQWRMHRILSYAHGPASYTPPKPSLSLSTHTLDQYAGQYLAERVGQITVTREGDHLKLTAGSFGATLYAESPTRFFALERDVRFEFELTESGTVQGLAVYENGTVSERASRVK